jgi:hypothetical protein
MMKTPTFHNGQQGVVLIVSMILLVGVTVLALSSQHTGLMEVLMSDNDEARTRSFQSAQSGIEAVATDDNFPVVGDVGTSNCTASKSGVTCNQTSLALPGGFDTSKHWARTERLSPLYACPPRVVGTSCDNFKVAHFSVDSRYSGVPNRGGRSEVVQGHLIHVPVPSEETVIRDIDITAP